MTGSLFRFGVAFLFLALCSCAVPGNVLGAASRVTSRALHLAPTAAAAAGGL